MNPLGGTSSATGGLASRTGPGASLFGTLEERVIDLIGRFQKAQKKIDELELALAERDARLDEATRRADQADRLRDDLRARVEHLIEVVADLEETERSETEDSS